jgi:hypothetical protein
VRLQRLLLHYGMGSSGDGRKVRSRHSASPPHPVPTTAIHTQSPQLTDLGLQAGKLRRRTGGDVSLTPHRQGCVVLSLMNHTSTVQCGARV